MNTGRELDALIAEKVMGLEIGAIGDRQVIMQLGYGCGTYGCKKLHPRTMPNYSTSIADAWEVVEKLKEQGKHIRISAFDKGFGCEFENRFYKGEPDTWFAEADTAPHAICLAALKAMGHTFE